jgi:hypothetical protein
MHVCPLSMTCAGMWWHAVQVAYSSHQDAATKAMYALGCIIRAASGPARGAFYHAGGLEQLLELLTAAPAMGGTGAGATRVRVKAATLLADLAGALYAGQAMRSYPLPSPVCSTALSVCLTSCHPHHHPTMAVQMRLQFQMRTPAVPTHPVMMSRCSCALQQQHWIHWAKQGRMASLH